MVPLPVPFPSNRMTRPWELEANTKSRSISKVEPALGVIKSLAEPRPSEVMLYVLLFPIVAATAGPVGSLTSTTPDEIVPCMQPHATNVPAIVKMPAPFAPATENVYVPLKFELLNAPLGGGVGWLTLFPLPQPARTASAESIAGTMKRLGNDITSPLTKAVAQKIGTSGLRLARVYLSLDSTRMGEISSGVAESFGGFTTVYSRNKKLHIDLCRQSRFQSAI